MPAGRPPKPTALKILHGDHKVHPERMRRNEPMPVGPVEPTPYLSKPARDIWDAVAPSMIDCALLRAPDVPLFGELCEALVIARIARVRAVQEAAGRLTVPPGAVSASAIWGRAMVVVVQLGSRFGMTPGDRARLDVGKPESSASDLLSGWS